MPPSTSASAGSICEILEWDSAFFGRRIARYTRPNCVPDDIVRLNADAEARGIECVYILVDASDTASTAALQRSSAFLADIRVTFGTGIDREARLPEPGAGVSVRPASELDVAALKQIASVSHRDTRFYADVHFDQAACDRLYAVWIENSCRGFADAVLVAETDGGEVAGYVTCHKSSGTRRGHIGLFAVAEHLRGRHVGRSLMDAALAWFAAREVDAMSVATQLRNLAAVRFYEHAGLLVSRAELWFHLWPGDFCG